MLLLADDDERGAFLTQRAFKQAGLPHDLRARLISATASVRDIPEEPIVDHHLSATTTAVEHCAQLAAGGVKLLDAPPLP